MASQTAPAPDQVGAIVLLPVASIQLGERLRPVDPVWAAALGRIIAQDGQDTPIVVRRHPLSETSWILVAGGHRLEGARMEGLAYLQAVVVDVDAAQARMKEVSENLHRKGLGPVDRAAFIAELHSLLKIRDGVDPAIEGRSISAQARWQKALKTQADDATATIAIAYGWTDELAARLGFSARTIRDDLLLHRRLQANVAERLRDHPIATNAGQLRALAKLEPARQREAAEMLTSGHARNVSGALAILDQKVAPAPAQKRLNAFFGAWGRMSDRERDGALALIAKGDRGAFARFAARQESAE